MSTLFAYEQNNLNDWRRAHAECELMHQWAFDVDAQADLREEVGRERCVPDCLMARVHARRNWYLRPNSAIYPSLEAYIDATRAALDADVLAYQAEVAAAEDVHRERQREALKAERAAAEPPAPERAQPPRASKRVMCFH
jgi:hypothetical protein